MFFNVVTVQILSYNTYIFVNFYNTHHSSCIILLRECSLMFQGKSYNVYENLLKKITLNNQFLISKY